MDLLTRRVRRFMLFFFFSSRRRHTRWTGDWSSDVCSSDLPRDEPDVGTRELLLAIGTGRGKLGLLDELGQIGPVDLDPDLAELLRVVAARRRELKIHLVHDLILSSPAPS